MARLAVMLTCLCATSSFAGTAGTLEGWELEHGVDPPSYAVIDPQSTDLNIDSVVLVCEDAGDSTVLQLQLYLSTEGPWAPQGVPAQWLKDDPRADIAIDGRIFPVAILFADDYVVLADETAQMFPRLSERLLGAMDKGGTMIRRFNLVTERAGQLTAYGWRGGGGSPGGGAEARLSLPCAAARRPRAWSAPGMIVSEARAVDLSHVLAG